MNISVYWSFRDFNTTSIKIDAPYCKNRFFNRGSFIVPFTGDELKDRLIVSIIHDYEYRSEIESFYPVESYYITYPLSLDVYPLNYPRCAYHFGEAVSYFLLSSYLDLLLSGGFFDNQLLLDDQIADRLNNKNFDLFIWPGANTARGLISPIKTGLHLDASEAIRSFVRNGGGYIGSCYGAVSASSGILLPFTLPQYYLKDFPTTIFLSLLPSIVLPIPFRGGISVEVKETDNPVTFGLNHIERSWFGEGPTYLWIGKQVEILGVLNNTETNWLLKSRNGFSSNIINRWVNISMQKPIWVTSRFGKGRIVVFGDHPELPEPENNARLIYNAILYVSSEDKKQVYTPYYRNFQWIKVISIKTNDIPIEKNITVFKTIWFNYSLLYDLSGRLDVIREEILNEAYLLLEKNRIDTYTYFLLHSEYRDSYQRWLKSFSNSLDKLEGILATTSYSTIDLWRENTNNLIDNGISRLENLLNLSMILLYKMKNFVETSKEKIDLISLAWNTDRELRDLRNIFIELTQSTIKLYREIWYKYEAMYQPDVTEKSVSIGDPSFKQHNIIYVDDDAHGIGNGSINSPFKSIQDAIDFSSNGDTIIVRKGVYHENIIIHKSIRLIGEDKKFTIIDAMRKPRHIVIAVAPNVEIRNLTVQNSSIEAFSSGILLQSSNNIVSGNILRKNRMGIGFRPWSQNNIIENNIIIDNRFAGIGVDEINCFNNTFIGNILSNNSHKGLFLYNVPARVINNSFLDDGIYIIPSEDELKPWFHNNTLDNVSIIYLENKDNIVLENVSGQIIISNSHDIVIKNGFIRKTGEGILIFNSDNITIMNISLEENLVGIKIDSSNNVKICNINISNSYNVGIWIEKSKYTDIIGNSFYRNRDGLLLLNSDRNLVKENLFYGNIIGMYISSSNSNHIDDNIFRYNDVDSFNKWM